MAASEITLEECERRLQVARWERDQARAKCEAIVAILSGIHALLDPPLVETPDGKTLRFANPMAAEVLQELSARIRAVPEQIAAIRAGGQAHDSQNHDLLARARVLAECSPGTDLQDRACDMRQAAWLAVSEGK